MDHQLELQIHKFYNEPCSFNYLLSTAVLAWVKGNPTLKAFGKESRQPTTAPYNLHVAN